VETASLLFIAATQCCAAFDLTSGRFRQGEQLLPPYSPEFSPIENCWSKLKTKLRSAKARTRQALDEALSAAIDSISAADAKGWFKHCGYPLH
jgi:hypothetical protein